VAGIPTQVLAVGVTSMVAVIGFAEVLVALKPVMSPEPLAASPMAVLLLVQVYVAPLVGLIKLVAATDPPLQTVILAGTITVGVGLTVMVYEDGVPGQLLAVGVTVMIAEMGSVVIFTALKPAISPEPLANRPMAVLLLVQV